VQLPPDFGLAPRRGRLDPLLELIFPSRCAGCDARGALLCVACRPRLPWLDPNSCPRCAEPARGGAICRRCLRAGQRVLSSLRAACRYEGAVRNAIRRLKYSRVRLFAVLAAQLVAADLATRPLSADLVVPVPLSDRRQRERGYNQSELIARELAGLGVLPAPVPAALERSRDTRPQVELPRSARLENVRGAFVCERPELVAGRRVLLVDDVSTTGATLEACAASLIQAGAARVLALVVAKSGTLQA
jgi:ComF family protein